MKEIARYSGCFICGDKNEAGIKARFYFKNNKAYTECVAERRFEGYHDVYHGGLTSALLDEVMIKALLAQGIFAMTVELNVRYHKAIYIGQRLFFEGRLVEKRGRIYQTQGQAVNSDKEVVASAIGKYLSVKEPMKSKLLESLER